MERGNANRAKGSVWGTDCDLEDSQPTRADSRVCR